MSEKKTQAAFAEADGDHEGDPTTNQRTAEEGYSMTDTKTEAAKFTPREGKPSEVVTMADLRAAAFGVTGKYGQVTIDRDGDVWQASGRVGSIDGEVSGE